MTKKRFPGWLKYAVLLTVFTAIVVYNQQFLNDWYRLYHYTPSQEVKSLADNTTMTPAARRLFYIYHPKIEDKSDFTANCDVEDTIVLGCYVSGIGIYIYHVTNQQLASQQEVTAAHEMLHVAYERLSNKERQNVDKMTQQAFSFLNDKRITDTIEQYREKDPDVVNNEIHSILGSEVRNLPKELEDYYKKYFDNRLSVVAYSEAYNKTFADIQTQVTDIDNRLSALKKDIENYELSLTKLGSDLSQQFADLQQIRQSGQTDNYNLQAKSYNQRVYTYNQQLSDYKAKIFAYNELINQRNRLSDQQQALVNAIDTRAVTPLN